jgi:flagellar biosynthesis protein FlhB
MLILVLSNLASTTLCMAVGVATSSDATANVASTFLMVASMLYGGFLLSLKDMPPSMQLLSELSFVKHAFEVETQLKQPLKSRSVLNFSPH